MGLVIDHIVQHSSSRVTAVAINKSATEMHNMKTCHKSVAQTPVKQHFTAKWSSMKTLNRISCPTVHKGSEELLNLSMKETPFGIAESVLDHACNQSNGHFLKSSLQIDF